MEVKAAQRVHKMYLGKNVRSNLGAIEDEYRVLHLAVSMWLGGHSNGYHRLIFVATNAVEEKDCEWDKYQGMKSTGNT